MASRVHKNVTFLVKNTKKTAKKNVQFSPCWIWCQNVPSVCVFVCLFVCLFVRILSKKHKKKKSQIAKLKSNWGLSHSPFFSGLIFWGMWSACNAYMGREKIITFWVQKTALSLLFLIKKNVHPTLIFLIKNRAFSMAKIK